MRTKSAHAKIAMWGTAVNAIEPKSAVWEVRWEILYFQFGPFLLGKLPFKALVLVSNPFALKSQPDIPLACALERGCRGVVSSAVPVGDTFATLSVKAGILRYAIRYGDRYLVDLNGSFPCYLGQLSGKSRRNLQRNVKKLAASGNENPDVREYSTPLEIRAFRDIALRISARSYKHEIGWGFQNDPAFGEQLERDAEDGSVRGFVLLQGEEPAAYALCRISGDVIVYKHIGYDDRFATSSPGTTLLFLMLQRFFESREFRLLDFDGTEFYAYKKFFSTRAVRCARVVWLPATPRNSALIGAHWIVTATWRLGAGVRDSLRRRDRGWVSARALVARTKSLHTVTSVASGTGAGKTEWDSLL